MAHESSTPISQAPTDASEDAQAAWRHAHAAHAHGQQQPAAAATAAAHTRKQTRSLSAKIMELKGKIRTLETRLETLSKLVNVSIAHFA